MVWSFCGSLLKCRDIQLLVRTKLLARKLGYTQANAKLGKTGTSSDGGCGSFGEVATADIAGLLTTAVLNTPGGLNSCQYKAAIDALVDKELERQVRSAEDPLSITCMQHKSCRHMAPVTNTSIAVFNWWRACGSCPCWLYGCLFCLSLAIMLDCPGRLVMSADVFSAAYMSGAVLAV